MILLFKLGDYYVDVDCIPPRYSFYYDKVGSAPRAAQLMIDEVCLIDNPDAFYAAQTNPSLATLQQLASNS